MKNAHDYGQSESDKEMESGREQNRDEIDVENVNDKGMESVHCRSHPCCLQQSDHDGSMHDEESNAACGHGREKKCASQKDHVWQENDET